LAEAAEKDDASDAVFDLMPSPTVTVMPVARLEFRAHRSHGAPSGDTPAKPASGGVGGGFMIREDTSFHDMPAMPAMPASGGGSGFMIREDTSFQDMPASGSGGGGGFMIREDTSCQGFISDVCAQEVALQGLQGTGTRTGTNCDGAGANSKSSGAFVMREDTELKVTSRSDAAAAGGFGGGGSVFMIREDTNLKGFHLQVSSASRFHAHLPYVHYYYNSSCFTSAKVQIVTQSLARTA
jgi:hypothetical protein